MKHRRYKVTATTTYEVIADTPEDAEWRMRWLIKNAALRFDLTVHEDEDGRAE
jgi:hypothetical protein